MTLVFMTSTAVLNRYSQDAAKNITPTSSITEGAIKAVQVVQAFDAFHSLTTDHRNNLKEEISFGVKKSIAGAVLRAGDDQGTEFEPKGCGYVFTDRADKVCHECIPDAD
jgi:hypothetical protein